MKIVYLREIVSDVFFTLLGIVCITTHIMNYEDVLQILPITIYTLCTVFLLGCLLYNIKNYNHKLAKRSKLLKKVTKEIFNFIDKYNVRSWDKDKKLQEIIDILNREKNKILARIVADSDYSFYTYLLNNIKIGLDSNDNIELSVNVDLEEVDK